MQLLRNGSLDHRQPGCSSVSLPQCLEAMRYHSSSSLVVSIHLEGLLAAYPVLRGVYREPPHYSIQGVSHRVQMSTTTC